VFEYAVLPPSGWRCAPCGRPAVLRVGWGVNRAGACSEECAGVVVGVARRSRGQSGWFLREMDRRSHGVCGSGRRA
jgi:hypothetical protein